MSKKIYKPITEEVLLSEWAYDLNGDKEPSAFSSGSHEYVFWRCSKCSFVWRSKIYNRAILHRGCPACSHHAIYVGKNDLETVNPSLASEWDYDKNFPLKPSLIHANSNKKYWWKCPRGHSYQATPNHRNGPKGTNCPICTSGRQTSFAEQAVYFYIKKIFPNSINRYKDIFTNGMEIDIYIPDLKLGIEYDGEHWHGNNAKMIEREKKKYNICRKNGIKLIRIMEKYDSSRPFYADRGIGCPENEEDTEALNHTIMIILSYVDPKTNPWTRLNPLKIWSDVSVDVERDRFDILSYLKGPIKNSLQASAPEIAEEWDYDSNRPLTPEMICSNSKIKVFWVCKKCGYKWSATASHRAREHTGCPRCYGLVLEKGINDFATKYPALLADWDYEKNKALGINPNEILHNSGVKVFWKCSACGYKWSSKLFYRTSSGRGCKKCGYKKAQQTKKMLAISRVGHLSNELLLSDWDYEKNNGLRPEDFPPTSSQKIHWKCSTCGHEWVAKINDRINGRGCKICATKKAQAQKIQTKIKNGKGITNELLLKEWDYSKNPSPNLFSNGSGKNVWWICSKCGYKWNAKIYARSKGSGCPSCAGNILIAGKNDLATKYPKIAKEWDYEKNNGLGPNQVSAHTSKKYWWKCFKGHDSYLASPSHRVSGTGCPKCGKDLIFLRFSIQVEQLTAEGFFVKSYKSIKEAALCLKLNPSAITKAIKENRLYGGFKWRYKK